MCAPLPPPRRRAEPSAIGVFQGGFNAFVFLVSFVMQVMTLTACG